MTPLSAWTAGLVGERDPAQPLLTLLDGPARVELSGATTGNWVAKSANLLVDGLGSPARVGLQLPLHWQTVCLLLAGVAAGAEVAVGGEGDVVLTTQDRAAQVEADEVLALSGHPLGAPCGPLPPTVQDYAREVPSYADHWGGPRPAGWAVTAGGTPVEPAELGLTAADRVLLTGDPADPVVLSALLGVLHAGAALLLVPDPATVDPGAVVAGERATAAHGLSAPGLRSLG